MRQLASMVRAATMAGAVAGLALTGFIGAGSQASAQQSTADLRIATGGPTGTYFVIGRAICYLLREQAKAAGTEPMSCQADVTGGSIANIEALRSGTANIAIVQSDVQYHAANGTGPLEGNGLDGLRVLFSVYAEPYHLIAKSTAGVGGVTDLRGKRMSIGNPGSGQRVTTELLLQAHGLSPDDLAAAPALTALEQDAALCNGEIDVLAHVVAAPNEGLARVMDECAAAPVPVTGLDVELMIQDNPFLSQLTIPEGTYAAAPVDIVTFGPVATVVATEDTPEEQVRAVLSAVFDDLALFRRLHPALKPVETDDMVRRGITARLHPAAIAYLSAKGLL